MLGRRHILASLAAIPGLAFLDKPAKALRLESEEEWAIQFALERITRRILQKDKKVHVIVVEDGYIVSALSNTALPDRSQGLRCFRFDALRRDGARQMNLRANLARAGVYRLGADNFPDSRMACDSVVNVMTSEA